MGDESVKKIISLFQRNYDGDRLVRDELVPDAEWVAAGEGVATRKFDGTCCLIDGGRLFKRYELKPGRSAPAGFLPAQQADDVTGELPGWVPVGDGPEDAYHREAFARLDAGDDGTYELIGPKVNLNLERAATHCLVRHDGYPLNDVPRDYAGLREYLAKRDIEGVVWHHPDGRMAKIKGKDFGFKRYREETDEAGNYLWRTAP